MLKYSAKIFQDENWFLCNATSIRIISQLTDVYLSGFLFDKQCLLMVANAGP